MNKLWIKCSDQMPPLLESNETFTEKVLCANTARYVWVAYFDYSDFSWIESPRPLIDGGYIPTHWMKLPALPEEDEEDESC